MLFLTQGELQVINQNYVDFESIYGKDFSFYKTQNLPHNFLYWIKNNDEGKKKRYDGCF
jgi:hypothetical protein